MRIPLAALLVLLTAVPLLGAAPVSYEGRLVVPPDVDVERLVVALHDRAPSDAENAIREPLAETQPDETGTFVLELPELDPADGDYEVEIVGPGVRRARFPLVVGLDDSIPRFTLREGVVSTVTVTDEASGEPIAGARVGPLTLADERVERSEAQRLFPFFAQTDDSGRAAVEGLLPGFIAYDAVVTAPGYERRKVRLASGHDTSIALPEGGLSLSGNVVGERSLEPRPGARVMLDGGERYLSIESHSDEEGAFAFEGLPRGDYQLVAYSEGQTTAEALEVTLLPGSPGEGISLTVFEGLDITGTVFDAESDEPIQGADVFLDPQTEAAARTNDEGHFRIEGITGPWPLALRVAKDGFAFDPENLPAELRVMSPSMGDVRELRLRLQRERWIVVRAPEFEGSGLIFVGGGGTTAQERREHADAAQTARISGTETHVRVERAGPHVLFVQKGNEAASDLLRTEIELQESETAVEAELHDPARLTGRVVRPQPDAPEATPPPLPRFTAVLSAEVVEESGEWTKLLSVGGDGESRFNFGALPAGQYRLTIARPDSIQPFHEQVVALDRGESVEIEIELEPGHSLEGFVFDPYGEPLLGADVSVLARDPAGETVFLTRRTNADGSFSFEELGGDSVREVRAEHGMYAPWSESDVPLDGSTLNIELQGWERVRVVLPDVPPADAAAYLMMANRSVVPFVGTIDVYTETVRAAFRASDHVDMDLRMDGRYRVAVERAGYWDVSDAFEWSRGSEGLEISLNPGASVAGRLRVTVDGVEARTIDAVAENVSIPSHRTNTEFSPTAASADVLTFDDIPPGVYLLTLLGEDGSSAIETDIEVPRGGTREVRVSMERAETELIGTVLIGEEPAAGAEVSIFDPDVPESAPLQRDRLGSEGRFVFPALQPGRNYALRIEAEGFDTRHQMVRIPSDAGESVSEVFVLETRVLVRLDVTDAMRSGPRPLLLFPADGGASTVVPPAAMDGPVEVLPGSYRVTWGEEPIGTAEVPASGGTEPPLVQIVP